MTKRYQDFETYTGNTEIVDAQVLDKAGAPQPLTGATIYWVMKQKAGDTTALIEKDNDQIGGASITDANNGWIRIVISPADTENLVSGRYYHECKVKLQSSEETTVFTGTVRLFTSGFTTLSP